MGQAWDWGTAAPSHCYRPLSPFHMPLGGSIQLSEVSSAALSESMVLNLEWVREHCHFGRNEWSLGLFNSTLPS